MLIERPAPHARSWETAAKPGILKLGFHQNQGETWQKRGAQALQQAQPPAEADARQSGRSTALSSVHLWPFPPCPARRLAQSELHKHWVAARLQTSCSSLLMAARRSPHGLARSLITIEFAASGPGSSAPPAAAFRICTVVVRGLFLKTVLWLCHVSRLSETPPPLALSKKTWVLEVRPGCPSRGEQRGAQGLCPSGLSLNSDPPFFRVSPSTLWALFLHL